MFNTVCLRLSLTLFNGVINYMPICDRRLSLVVSQRFNEVWLLIWLVQNTECMKGFDDRLAHAHWALSVAMTCDYCQATAWRPCYWNWTITSETYISVRNIVLLYKYRRWLAWQHMCCCHGNRAESRHQGDWSWKLVNSVRHHVTRRSEILSTTFSEGCFGNDVIESDQSPLGLR